MVSNFTPINENGRFYPPFKDLPQFTDGQINFILRLLKREFECVTGCSIDDDVFLDLIMASFRCGLNGHKDIGCRMGIYMPFAKVLMNAGYRGFNFPTYDFNDYNNYTHKIMNFMFGKECKSSQNYSNIILHVPHSSTQIPYEYCGNYSETDLHLYNEEIKPLIDYYTDELFVPANLSEELKERIVPIVFPVCRVFCDVERLPNDPLEKQHLGIIYGNTIYGKQYGKRLLWNECKLYELYQEHQYNIAKTLLKALNNGNRPFLLDCHSFGTQPHELLQDPIKYSWIDICVGYNDDETHPDNFVISTVVWYFRNLGYKVAVNKPFSNSKTVDVPVRYHSLMIEVNKRLYMNEETLEKTDNFSKVQQDIQGLYPLLLKKEKKY
ncbi:MAG: hypothetical protein EOM76_02505 [Sphingobacteriia bacterium]|jgi:N-formylglutamate deformylase|nr:hypothetical protein [Sphingobacteriia bacterium]